jgi:CHASE2 domain-containing sensor protein
VTGRRPRGRAWIGLVAAAAAAAAVALGARYGDVFKRQELSSIDARFAVRGRQKLPQDVMIVGVDDRSLAALRATWPLPRSDEGQVIQQLAEDGAKVIAVDIQFTEPTTSDQDNALMESVQEARNVVLATSETDGHGHTNVFGGDAEVREVDARVGNDSIPVDADGVMRRLPFEVGGLTEMAIVTADEAEGRSIGRSAFGGGTALIDYRGGTGSFQTVSFYDVYAGRVPASVVRGKIVVVGVTAPELEDIHATPTSAAMSGPEIQANAIWTVLHDFPLRPAGDWLVVLLIVAAAFVTPLAAWRLGILRSLLVALAAALGYLVAVQIAFDHGLVLPVVCPLLALVLGGVGTLIALAPRSRPARGSPIA